MRAYVARQRALPGVSKVRAAELQSHALPRLFPEADVRCFDVVSTLSPEEARRRGAPGDAERFYVRTGDGRLYTVFDRRDMLALGRAASLRLDIPQRRKWFAGQVASGPVIVAVREDKKGTRLIE